MYRSSLLLALGLSAFGCVTFAQSEIGGATVNGTVTDPAGAAVPGAKVTVTDSATGIERVTNTSEAGMFSFNALPSGAYDLNVEARGFKAGRRTGIGLTVGAVNTVDVALVIGAAQETVSVTASDAPLVEFTRSQTSTTVTSGQVSGLPVNGRNFLDFTLLTPGVVRDPTRGGDLSFGGQRGTSNSLLVDGADSNNGFFGQSTGRAGTGRNPYSFSQDAVQEFQVSTNGYAAEVGRAGGGVINVITKSGTNDFHGAAFEFFRDKALNANSWENNKNGRRKRAYHFNQFGGDLGGPMVKNKLFFFFDYDGQRNTTPNPVFFTVPPPADAASQQAAQMLQPFLASYTNSLNNDVYLGKADWEINTNQRLSVRYNANRFKGVNFENTGSASALAHTGNASVSTDNVALNHTLVIGSQGIAESRFAVTRDDEPGLANSTAPEAFIRQKGTQVLAIGRNDFSPRYTNAKTYQWTEGVSYAAGRHSLKAGIDLNFQRIANFFPGNFSGSYTFNSYADFTNNKPFSYTQAFAGSGTPGPLSNPDVNEYAFYLQDSWRATSRLTLNYGIRYDVFNYRNPTVMNPDAGLAALHLNTSQIPFDSGDVAPRAGFAYKMNSSGTMAVRGGYGIYYGRTPSILTGTAFTQNGIQVQTYTLNAATGGIPTYPNILPAPPALSRHPDIFTFASNYRQPSSQQWSLNLETQIARNYVLTLGYLGVKGSHLTRTRDINLFPALALAGCVGPASGACGDSDHTAVVYNRHPGAKAPARPDANFGRISIVDSGADSIYHAGFIQLTRRFSRGLELQTSYTFAKAIDSDPDQTQVVVGADDAKQVQDTLAPNADRGRGNSDIRHRLLLAGTWDLFSGVAMPSKGLALAVHGFQFSTITTFQSVPTTRSFQATSTTMATPARIVRRTWAATLSTGPTFLPWIYVCRATSRSGNVPGSS